jgi:hypothetical protein
LAQQRGELSRDLEAIGDRVSPGRMVGRRKAAVRQRFGRMKDSVMGAAEDATHTVGEKASSTASTMRDSASSMVESVERAPEMARERAQGNPMAAGLIAFGAGLLVSTMVPATRREEAMAQRVQPLLESAASDAGSAAQEAAQELKSKAQETAEELKESAQEHVENVKSEARDAAPSGVGSGG